MQKLKVLKYFIPTLSFATVVANLCSPVLAQKAYLRQAMPIPAGITGSRFTSVNGQEHLISTSPTASAANRDKVIAKQTWLVASVPNVGAEWVEVGSVKGWSTTSGGTVNATYWAGHYYARQKIVSGQLLYFRSYSGTSAPGSSSPTGSQTYQVNYAGLINGTPYWNFYVNNIFMGNLDHTRTAFTEAQIGIETNSTCNSFTSGTKSQAIQTRNTAGTWTSFPNPAGLVTTAPSNTGAGTPYPTWLSVYSSATNTVNFTQSTPPASCP